MATIGYARVSTRDQDLTLQHEALKGAGCEKVFAEKRKAEFDKYLTKLRAEAIIEFRNTDIKKAYQVGLERMKAGPAQ